MHDFASKRLKVPAEIKPLIDEIRVRLSPDSIWLFGSRARGDNRPDSDWDILVALPDDAKPELLDPLVAWTIQHEVGIPATILSTTSSEIGGKLGFAEYDRVRRFAGRAPTRCLTTGLSPVPFGWRMGASGRHAFWQNPGPETRSI